MSYLPNNTTDTTGPYYPETNLSNTESKQTEIKFFVSDMKHSISLLQNALNDLNDKLAPILTEEEIEKPQLLETKREPLTPLGKELKEQDLEISTAVNKIRTLIDRIGL